MAQTDLRAIPSIEKLVSGEALRGWSERLTQPVRVRLAQRVVAQLRERVRAGDECPTVAAIEAAVERAYRECVDAGMRKAINATGVVLHTNLGRAPLSRAWLTRMADELDRYCTLEFDAEKGERGSRNAVAEERLKLLLDVEGAVVVNNCAAAVFLVLQALAAGRGTLISRGELVQIGGGFRIPDILAASGSRLVEVGTTNMTAVGDYERELQEGHANALILKVHHSNFVIVGHTEAPSVAELAKLAKARGVPLAVDLGSGAMKDWGVGEPTVADVLRAGADLVCFSGDKLLGGPQAGIVVGSAAAVKKLKESPFYRAIRPAKTEIFLLEQCLLAHLRGEMTATSQAVEAGSDELKARAEALLAALESPVVARLVEGTSSLGGGTTPGVALQTWLVELIHPDPESYCRRLLAYRPAIVVRRENKKLALDLRTVSEDEQPILARAIRGCWR